MTTLSLTRLEYVCALMALADAWETGDAREHAKVLQATRRTAKDHCRKSPPKSR